MQSRFFRAAMVGTFVGLVTLAAYQIEAQRFGGGRGGGFRGGGSMSMSRGGAISNRMSGSGFSRGGSYSRPSGGYSRPSQLPAQGGNRNINRGNINTGNVNINRNVHVNNNLPGWGGWRDYPIARGIAIGAVAGATAAVIGSAYYALPPACSPYPWHSYTYYSCGGAWYKPQYEGDTIVYVTVPKPE